MNPPRWPSVKTLLWFLAALAILGAVLLGIDFIARSGA
jgi:cytochrome c oxidase assembly factor CtaG